MSFVEIKQLMHGSLVREGAGVKLHRYIGADRSNDFEPFLLFDYFNSKEKLDFIAGFPTHPHRGFETITYLLQGSITHEDNKGHKGVIHAGDVQWMTAGKGIMHSEMPAHADALQGIQLWLNLPAADKMTNPRYQEKTSAELPVTILESGIVVKVIAGTSDAGVSSPIVGIATKPLFLDVIAPATTTFQQTIPKDYQAILFVVKGQIHLGGQSIREGYLAAFTDGEKVLWQSIEDSQCFLIAAKKIHEPIARYGPFVMNTQEEIMQAMSDFRSGNL
ncbi:pirin family protein [Legionella waltersii]|uniref:Pirin-like protein n=1 Tax=Legionella waltersii TaxID=66969 RepID=A0A0W1A5B0_9GAMM|nr:pirin family protein [Legionella waltersii]KTD76502.1 pirin-like protein [Legionella waltersii]SNU93775.1 pirin-like protein [Legionella waltersii]